MENNVLINVSRFLLIILFIYTGLSKLLNIQGTYLQLQQIFFIKSIAGPLSIALPVLEILAGLALVFTRLEKLGWWLSTILMLAFTIYITAVLFMDPKLRPCTCGGVISSMSWREHLVFNIIFLALANIGLYQNFYRKIFSTDKKEVS